MGDDESMNVLDQLNKHLDESKENVHQSDMELRDRYEQRILPYLEPTRELTVSQVEHLRNRLDQLMEHTVTNATYAIKQIDRVKELLYEQKNIALQQSLVKPGLDNKAVESETQRNETQTQTEIYRSYSLPQRYSLTMTLGAPFLSSGLYLFLISGYDIESPVIFPFVSRLAIGLIVIGICFLTYAILGVFDYDRKKWTLYSSFFDDVLEDIEIEPFRKYPLLFKGKRWVWRRKK